MIDPIALEKSLSRLGDLAPQHRSLVPRLQQWVLEAGANRLERLAPVWLAQSLGVEVPVAVELLLYAVKAGLLELLWNSHCPMCGSLVHGLATLNQLESNFYCLLCEAEVSNELDDQVEINFTLAKELGASEFDPYGSLENYQLFCFSENLIRSKEFESHLKNEAQRGFMALEAGTQGKFRTRLGAGEQLRLMSLENDARLWLRAVQGAKSSLVQAQLLPGGFELVSVEVAPGELEIEVSNLTGQKAGFLLILTNTKMVCELLEHHPSKMRPFVSGKEMLNSQSFRELFPVQNLPLDLSLKLRDLTLLFTDLKGSTELYSRTGDISAYKLVRQHFELLTQGVKKSGGAIVKTMGDAVMASFSKPAQGLDAAFLMMESLAKLNQSLAGPEAALGLKVGLHSGAAIAVNANQSLDFFGQSVNIAARVQGLAQAGEIWFTRPVFDDPGVQQRLAQWGLKPEASETWLKGVAGPQAVYRLAGER